MHHVIYVFISGLGSSHSVCLCRCGGCNACCHGDRKIDMATVESSVSLQN